jgi:hypothetical protein
LTVDALTVWAFFPPALFRPFELERVGDGDGGKWVCGLSQLEEKEGCVVYSVGTRGPSSSPFETRYPTGPSTDASFKAELLARMRHCQPFIFDHTASALPRRLSTLATAPARFHKFYASLEASNYDNTGILATYCSASKPWAH